MKTEAETGATWPQTGNTWSHQTRKRQEKLPTPQSLWREHGPADTLISDFRPPDCERMNSWCFKPPSLWSFVTAAQETHTADKHPVWPAGKQIAVVMFLP